MSVRRQAVVVPVLIGHQLIDRHWVLPKSPTPLRAKILGNGIQSASSLAKPIAIFSDGRNLRFAVSTQRGTYWS